MTDMVYGYDGDGLGVVNITAIGVGCLHDGGHGFLNRAVSHVLVGSTIRVADAETVHTVSSFAICLLNG